LPSTLITLLAKLRTDLDRFAPEEADLLSYHGYWSTHAARGAAPPTSRSRGRPGATTRR
jgi:hypothetical protein